MELAQGGDLVKMLKLTEPVATFYAAEIALALEFLHKKGIVHRDLKPENVLLDKGGHIKVSDFGVASLGLFGKDRMNTFYGSSDYVAPEIAQGLAYKHDVDWWALGIMIYEMLVGSKPFNPDGGFNTLKWIDYDDIRHPEWLSKEAESILQGFLNKDPKSRLTDHDSIRRHPFFAALKWEELEKKQVKPPMTPNIVETSKHQVDIAPLAPAEPVHPDLQV